MALKVEIISRETIKPSPPTPAHKRNHRLTLLDQTAPAVYIPLCLFYPNAIATDDVISVTLKASLSSALSLYYPLAGRYKDAAGGATTLECNDRGVDFVEARVPCRMADAIRQHPDEDRLLPLLPCLPRQRYDPDSELTLLALQLNTFDCGGVAIGICLWHGVADACTLVAFLREWGRITSAGGGHVVGTRNDVVQDLTSLFPPRDPSTVEPLLSKLTAAVTTPNTTTKRFVFEGPKIAALRREIGRHSPRPTRVEAVSALIWAAVIRISKPRPGPRPNYSSTDYSHVATRAINLRTRMVPGIPEQVMANAVTIPTVAEWDDPVAAADDDCSSWHGVLAEKLRDVVVMVNDDNARNLLGSCDDDDDDDDVFLDIFRIAVDAFEKGDMLVISSWCRFPFYETDFGWGKPAWLGFYTFCHSSAVLIDAEDGEGIEAWVALSGEGMSEFVNSPAILRYASCKPPVVRS